MTEDSWPLPLEQAPRDAVRLYLGRLGVFALVIVANALLLGGIVLGTFLFRARGVVGWLLVLVGVYLTLALAAAIWRTVVSAGHRRVEEALPTGLERSGVLDEAVTAFNLGIRLSQQGDVAGARAAFQRATDTRDPELAAMAALQLGMVLVELGDVAGARIAFQRATDTPDRELAAVAALQLGMLLVEQGDVKRARVAFQRATDTRDNELAAIAAFNLGVLLVEQGDVAGARAAFQRATDTPDDEVATRAREALRDLG